MSSVNLGENFLAGLRAPHYANGRLLTAEDLQADQEATLARIGLTGEAAGVGIVAGFEVTQIANNLKVTAGLGINRKGQAVRLNEESVELSLALLPNVSAVSTGDGRFNDCNLAPAEGGSLVESGAYLLAVTPVSQSQGAVSVKTISNSTTCASRWEIEGIQFQAIRLVDAPVRNANNAGIYRNLLAHWCFGTAALKDLPQNPFDFPARYSGLDLLSDDELTLCALPLAVFYWDNQTLQLVDHWAARRRITHAFPSEAWHALIADRRVADAQARFVQFQMQIDEIQQNSAQFPDLANRPGTADFRYLPPVGFLPIVPPDYILRRLIRDQVPIEDGASLALNEQILTELKQRIPTNRTFRLEAFFGTKLPHRIGLVDRETVEFRLNRSWYDEALDFNTLLDVTSSEDETAFAMLIIADELQALVKGLVKVRLENRLTTNDLQSLRNTLRNLGATMVFSSATGFRPMFGKQRLTLQQQRKRAMRTVAPMVSDSELADEAQIIDFITTAPLPPQYAMFVKTTRATRWVDKPRGDL
jgi:hypothetical protein